MKKVFLQEKSFNKITNNLAKVLVSSFNFSAKRGDKVVTGEDLYLAILSQKECLAHNLLRRVGVDTDRTFMNLMVRYANVKIATNGNQKFGDKAASILSKAFLIANEFRHVYVGTEHLLLAILKEEDLYFVKDLINNKITYDLLKGKLMTFGTYHNGVFSNTGGQIESEEGSSISYFTKNMNLLATQGKYLKVWGRDEEIQRIIHILSRKTKNNALLIGEAGVGKTAVVEGLVQKIIEGDVPISFRNKQVVQLDVSSIIAGSKIRGDVEERLLGIISEMASDKNKIIFIDEIHMIVGAGNVGSGGSMDVANIIKPYLTNGDLRIVGATTFDEYQKYIEEDEALARRFQTISVDEISLEDSIEVLKMLRPQFEEFHNVKISDEVINVATTLSNRYITNKYLPDKAIDVIDEASSAKRLAGESNNKEFVKKLHEVKKVKANKDKALKNNDIVKASIEREKEIDLKRKIAEMQGYNGKAKQEISVDDIRKVVSKWSSVPVETVDDIEVSKIKNLSSLINKNIIGQNNAVKKIVSTLKRARVGLSNAKKPLASFLFLGPTGVGKTQMSKEIASHFFGNEKSLIRIDMSEYTESHSVSKLIGSPPGYVGFQEGGQLTEQVKRKPYSVVLFDEIEKAHPLLMNVLLQILDEGILKDSKGRSVNFKNTVIVMTSNISIESSKENLVGFALSDVTDEESERENSVMSRLKEYFLPEFINRIDEIIVFNKLTNKDALKIVELGIKDINERLKEKNLKIYVEDKVLQFLVDLGFSEEFGARNIKRVIQEFIENLLAEFLIEKNIMNRVKKKTKINVSLKRKTITFEIL